MTDEFKKLLILVAFAVGSFWTLQHIALFYGAAKVVLGSLSPLFLGVIIAFVVNMPMDICEKKVLGKVNIKKGLKRLISLLVAYLFILLVIFIVIFMVVPQLGRTIMGIAGELQEWMGKIGQLTIDFHAETPQVQEALNKLSLDQTKINKEIIAYFQDAGTRLLNSTVAIISAFVSGITKLILGIVFSAYMLINKETLLKQARRLVMAFFPEKRAEHILGFGRLCCNTFHSFVAGQCLEAVILGCMFTVSMAVLRFPYALLIGVLISFTALIPIVGAFIGCGVGAFLILMESPAKAFWFIILFLVLQQVEGNLIYPKVVGNSVGLPSMWVLAAVTCGGTLMGILGMLFFIPVFSIIYTCVGDFVETRIRKRQLEKRASRG